MKFIYTIPVLMILCSLQSCNNDDDQTSTTDQNFFPLTANSVWNYNNTSDQGNTVDVMFVQDSQTVNNHTYTNINAEAPVEAFMTSIFSTNLVRHEGSKLLLFGEFSVPIEEFPDVSIPLNDVIVYDVDANPETSLSRIEGTIEQVFNEIPLQINYTVASNQLSTPPSTDDETLPSMQSNIILTLEVNALVNINDFELEIPVLASQDVLVVTNTYTENTGLVLSKAVIDYELEDLGALGVDLPFPPSDTITTLQTLDTYTIGE